MDYRFHQFKWMANMAGFNYPIDVFYGTIYLGTLEAKNDGVVIRLIDTPEGKVPVKQSDKNIFKTQDIAAKVLHKTWARLRSGK